MVHTMRAQDESIQNKNEPYVWHAQERPSASKPCVCCTQERSEARGYEPKWHFARHPARVVFFSGKRRRQLGGKKLQALSDSFVAVLLKRRNSHHLPEAHHVDPNVSTTNQVSALLHTRFSRFLGTRLRALGSGRSALHSIKRLTKQSTAGLRPSRGTRRKSKDPK